MKKKNLFKTQNLYLEVLIRIYYKRIKGKYMRVSNSINQPNFKSVSLLQFPREIFSNPNNLEKCSAQVYKELAKASGVKTEYKLSNVLAAFGIGKKNLHKFDLRIEYPSYFHSKTALQKNGDYSISWLSSNMNVPVKDAIDKDYHSFFVLTKEHKDKMLDFYKADNRIQIVREYSLRALYKYKSKDMQELFAAAHIGNVIDKFFEKVIGNAEIHRFQLNSLDEIKNIAPKLNF